MLKIREKEDIKIEKYNRTFDGLNDNVPIGSCLNAWSPVGKLFGGGMSLVCGVWG